MGDYRKLEVYQMATVFSDRVTVVVETLPVRFRAGVGDQLSRAADSIHEAIAEGCGLNSDPQLLKFLKIALGSANECEDELHTLNRRGLLAEEDKELLLIARRICAMLAKFISRIDGSRRRRPAGQSDVELGALPPQPSS